MQEDKTPNLAPQGYSTVSPYLIIKSVEKQIEFLQHVFGAEVIEEIKQPDETIMHGEVRIGNVVIMMGKARESNPALESMIYVFVEDVDETYKTALVQKATSMREPENQFYGYREAGFKDEHGNQWWVAQVVEELSTEEIEKRLHEKLKK